MSKLRHLPTSLRASEFTVPRVQACQTCGAHVAGGARGCLMADRSIKKRTTSTYQIKGAMCSRMSGPFSTVEVSPYIVHIYPNLGGCRELDCHQISIFRSKQHFSEMCTFGSASPLF